MTRITRYLVLTVIGATLVTLLVLLSLEMVFAYIEESDDIGRGDYTAALALLYVALGAPYRIYQAFPMATLIGSLMGLGALAARNELTAMRAAGVSVLGVARAAMIAGLLLSAGAFALGEWVAPPAERWAQELRASALDKRIAAFGGTGFWARDGERFVQVERALSPRELQGVKVFELDPQRRVSRIVTARRAVYAGGAWTLEQVIINRFAPAGVTLEHLPTLAWPSELEPQVLDVVVVEPESLPVLDLYTYIRYLERNGLASERYRLALWVKVATPLSTLVMLLLTVPLVFGAVRSAGTGQRVFLGVLIGLAFFLLNRLLNHVALLYGLPPALSALLPAALFLAAGIVGIRRVR